MNLDNDAQWHMGCIPLDSQRMGVMASLNKLWKRFWVIIPLFPPFFAVAFSREGLLSRDGRTLIWGKMRRSFISLVPPLARFLQKHYGLTGGCQNCGSSCKLLFQCPHWNAETRLCSVYEDRPNICRLFPITPGDIVDRNIVTKKIPCGFEFKKPVATLNRGKNSTLVPVISSSKSNPLPRD